MSTSTDIYAIAVICALLWPVFWKYIIAPLKIKTHPLMQVESTYVPFDPNTLGPEVSGFFAGSVQSLTARGFEVVQYLTKSDPARNIATVMMYLINRRAGERCMVICFYVTVNGITSVRNRNAIITSLYSQDAGIVTSNNKAGSVFRPRPGFDSATLVEIADVNVLLDIHRFRVARLADGRTPILPDVGRELEEWWRFETAAVDYQVKCGLAYLDRDKQTYFKTLLGAYYMTWQLLWPMKQIKLARRKRKAAEVLDEFRKSTQAY